MIISPASMELVVIAAVSVTAAVTDARTGRIPNVLTLPVACVGILGHLVWGGRAGLAGAVFGLAVSALVPFLLYRLSKGTAIGGGDLKLFAALGALAGPGLGLEIELASFTTLAGLALVRLAYQGKLLRVLSNVLFLGVNPFLPKRLRRPLAPEALTEMRMGPAIALGTLFAIFAAHVEAVAPWLA